MNELHKRIEASFNRQGFMKTLNASLDKVESGLVEISCAFTKDLSQQHNFFHAGAIAALADSACGYAAMTVAPADNEVLTVEFKTNFLKPATTAKITAVGKLIQAGKTLTVCEANVYDETGVKLIARMTATIMTMGSKRL